MHASGAHATTVHARATVGVKARMRRALRLRVTWAGFLLIIASFAIANILSGWVITWAIDERDVDEASSRFMLTGVWFGEFRLCAQCRFCRPARCPRRY